MKHRSFKQPWACKPFALAAFALGAYLLSTHGAARAPDLPRMTASAGSASGPAIHVPKQIEQWAREAIYHDTWAHSTERPQNQPDACRMQAVLTTTQAQSFRHDAIIKRETDSAARTASNLLNGLAVLDLDVLPGAMRGRLWSLGNMDPRKPIQLHLDGQPFIALNTHCTADRQSSTVTCLLNEAALQALAPQLAQGKPAVLAASIVGRGPQKFRLSADGFQSAHDTCADFVVGDRGKPERGLLDHPGLISTH